MPVRECEQDGKPGFQWGETGRCYTYQPGNDIARGHAKQRAILQGIAAGESPAEASRVVSFEEQSETEEVRWISDLAFEGEPTEDGRYILPGALDWRDTPQSLYGMTETGPGGHEGAFEAGKILEISKDEERDMDGEPLPEGVTAIRAYGIFDVEGERGAEMARLVEGEFIRGISVDLTDTEMSWRDPDTGELMEFAGASESKLQRAITKAKIGMATVCPLPAFANARIAITASGRIWLTSRIRIVGENLTASAAGLAPSKPPREWFYQPEPDQPTPLTVMSDGRVYGHMALWDSCHTGFPGQCIPPPKSASGYAYFNNGHVETAEGDRIGCGTITLDTLHAEVQRPISADVAKHHYEHTGIVAAYVRAVDGKHGIWVSGSLRPGLSEKHARDLMGAQPSGDWRQTKRGGSLEMIGVLAVNTGGYPVPRLAASALTAAGHRVTFEFGESPASGTLAAV